MTGLDVGSKRNQTMFVVIEVALVNNSVGAEPIGDAAFGGEIIQLGSANHSHKLEHNSRGGCVRKVVVAGANALLNRTNVALSFRNMLTGAGIVWFNTHIILDSFHQRLKLTITVDPANLKVGRVVLAGDYIQGTVELICSLVLQWHKGSETYSCIKCWLDTKETNG